MDKNTKKGNGILGGLIFLVVGIVILWSNEGRTVKTQSAILEAEKSYIQIKSDKIQSKNDGKLVATKGKIDSDSLNELRDDTFGINVKAVKLRRKVEMYQWEEDCEEDDNGNKNCTYEKVWDSKLLDSSEYTESGHNNPSDMPYESEEYLSDDVKLGSFIIPEELVKKLSYDKKKANDDLMNEYNNSKEEIKVDGKYLTNVKENTPEIGDIRISFEYTPAKTVSVMAVQTDDTFEAYTSKKGKDIYLITEGSKTGVQMLESMKSANKYLKWGLRFVGTLLIISSINSILSTITRIMGQIPVLGSIVTSATNIVSSLLGIGISLIIIAVAWFRFRPLLSIALIIVAVLLVVFLKFYKSNNKEETK